MVRNRIPYCLCEEGYHADWLDCVVNSTASPCHGVSCSDHGTCVAENGAPHCVCDDGYHAETTNCVRNDARAPLITDLSANVTTLHPRGALVFTATVTDPDGLEDIASGTLTTPGKAEYGVFAPIAPGQYEIRLTWDEIQLVSPIHTETGGSLRVFMAAFADEAGHPAVGQLSITLACVDPTLDALGEVGWHTSLALDTDGNPHIAHYDGSNGDLRYLRLTLDCP